MPRPRLRHDQCQLLPNQIAIDHNQDLRVAIGVPWASIARAKVIQRCTLAQALANQVLDLLPRFGLKPRGDFRFYRA